MQYQKPVIIQTQKLKMSPQMLQSIQLMALPVQDLKLRIQEEVEKNPALEVIEEKSEMSLQESESEQPEGYEFFENSSDSGYKRPIDQDASDAKQKFIEGALSRPESLQDRLLWQLRLQPISEDWFRIGELLIQSLDENGFLLEDPENFIPLEDIGFLPDIMALIQNFDPVGTCTSDYTKSLIVQIENDPDAPFGVKEVIQNHLKLLERKKLAEIARKMKISTTDVENILEYVKTLNPFPGRKYSTETAKYVIPDVMVNLVEGNFYLIINDEEIPVIGVNPFFTDISETKEKKEVKQYVNSKIRDARWFIRSVKQRNDTLLKISKAIIEFQRDFFIGGPRHLVPLTLKDIANEVSVHETTVSRISNSKYMQTEWGIFEIKYFFSNSISGSGTDGSRYSKEGVKQIVKEIIGENTSTKRLSDQKISDILKNRGINLARRTVAKYRNELDIYSSYDR